MNLVSANCFTIHNHYAELEISNPPLKLMGESEMQGLAPEQAYVLPRNAISTAPNIAYRPVAPEHDTSQPKCYKHLVHPY